MSASYKNIVMLGTLYNHEELTTTRVMSEAAKLTDFDVWLERTNFGQNMSKLVNAGLVEDRGKNTWAITEAGRECFRRYTRYLNRVTKK